MTMEMNVDIPANHRLMLEVPQEVPEGKAKITLSIKPFAQKWWSRLTAPKVRKAKQTAAVEDDEEERTDGILLPNGCTYYPALPGYTRPPLSPKLAAALKESAERAERRRTDPVYRAQVFANLRKSQEGPPIFGDMDGMEFQRQAREGWLD